MPTWYQNQYRRLLLRLGMARRQGKPVCPRSDRYRTSGTVLVEGAHPGRGGLEGRRDPGWIQAEGHAATVGVPQEPNLVPIGAVLERRCFAVKASPESWTAVRRSSSDVDPTIGTDGDGGSGIGAKLPIRIRPWSIVPGRPKRVTGGVI